MSIGRQVLREILEEIETEFFKRLETVPEGPTFPILETLLAEIKLEYQRSVNKAIADYLDKVYIG